ncbi:hypothetical protein KY495_17675 [Massilia sp. PAMC28688]|uniref:hypothetical protein n=1 Tax=Massilia sp. PAMC28688 TaxID=2861283 RepID=UPI001C62F841|nr:hypothetical protein [Massilia sp. PAMC28688]QYF92558.1 hypothetical protein KY495_17675 [Massilia sp. PAMC28688]
MRAIVLASLMLAAGAGQAQVMAAPEAIARGAVPAAVPMDAAEAGMLVQPSSAGSFRQWYAGQKRPALVVYFDKRLDQLPPGWTGETRLLIEESGQYGKDVEKRKLTVGVQHNTAVASAQRSQFATLVEQALQQELKREQFKVLDGAVLHRKLAATQPGEGSDIEYDSLKKSVRLVLEVQLAFIDGGAELLGAMKDIHSGDIVATVRMPVEGALDTREGIDRAARRLVQRLLKEKA